MRKNESKSMIPSSPARFWPPWLPSFVLCLLGGSASGQPSQAESAAPPKLEVRVRVAGALLASVTAVQVDGKSGELRIGAGGQRSWLYSMDELTPATPVPKITIERSAQNLRVVLSSPVGTCVVESSTDLIAWTKLAEYKIQTPDDRPSFDIPNSAAPTHFLRFTTNPNPSQP